MKGERVAFNQTSLFIQQAGGFGGRRTSDKSIMPVDAPKRKPDASIREKTSVDQVRNCYLCWLRRLARFCAEPDTVNILELILCWFPHYYVNVIVNSA